MSNTRPENQMYFWFIGYRNPKGRIEVSRERAYASHFECEQAITVRMNAMESDSIQIHREDLFPIPAVASYEFVQDRETIENIIHAERHAEERKQELFKVKRKNDAFLHREHTLIKQEEAMLKKGFTLITDYPGAPEGSKVMVYSKGSEKTVNCYHPSYGEYLRILDGKFPDPENYVRSGF